MKTLLMIYGTRPEVIKLYPLYQKLSKTFKIQCLYTGQQILSAHTFPVLPAIKYWRHKLTGSLFHRLIIINRRIAALSSQIKEIDGIIVQGDTFSAYAGGMYGFLNKIPVFHVEAGLRTGNLMEPFPEEYVRVALSKIATLHFAPTQIAYQNLINEGIPQQNIFLVGNTIVDMLKIVQKKIVKSSKKNYILITTHRKENIPDGIKQVCLAINKLAKQFPQYTFFYLTHQNPVITKIVNQNISSLDNIVLVRPLPYFKMILLLKGATLLLTDSGGLQEEAGILGVPTFILRNVTERTEILESGCGKLVGCSQKQIINYASNYLYSLPKGHIQSTTAFGTGNTSDKIQEKLVDFYNK